jgi:hypothetical protein
VRRQKGGGKIGQGTQGRECKEEVVERFFEPHHKDERVTLQLYSGNKDDENEI